MRIKKRKAYNSEIQTEVFKLLIIGNAIIFLATIFKHNAVVIPWVADVSHCSSWQLPLLPPLLAQFDLFARMIAAELSGLLCLHQFVPNFRPILFFQFHQLPQLRSALLWMCAIVGIGARVLRRVASK